VVSGIHSLLERSECHETTAYLRTEYNQEVRQFYTLSSRRVVAEFSAGLCISSMSSWRERFCLLLEGASDSMTLSDAFFHLFRVAE
jgi:hypothetical protein